MTETDYFAALNLVLAPALKDVFNSARGHYVIQEPQQKPFFLNTGGVTSHQAVKPDAMNGVWQCFVPTHSYAQKRCDRVVVAWDARQSSLKYLLIELKSSHSSSAHKQLGASLAFCHFLHRMVCVGQVAPPAAKFAAVTVWEPPNAMKSVSQPSIPNWTPQPLQPDCKHMHYSRSQGALPVKAVLAAF